MDIETKARLISIGTIEAPQLTQTGIASTSGPGAGGRSIFFRSARHIVRLSVVPKSRLKLGMTEDVAVVFQNDEELARGHLVEPILHCPGQAYITVSERCIHDCKFCAVPKLRGGVKSPELVRKMVDGAAASGRLEAISLTSGVETTAIREAERIAEIARDLRRYRLPIGVSVTPFPGVNELLRNAGVDEVKYNIETLDRDIFERVCPGISYEDIQGALNDAVAIFGRNCVSSNVIVGLGESDKTLRTGVNELTEMGVLPILRAVYPHPLRLGEIEMNRPSAERLLDLAHHLKRALDKNGLRGDHARTGCYLCTGCDLVPGRDL